MQDTSKAILQTIPYYSYVYLIQHKETKMMYIGSRYKIMKDRFHFIANYDLMEYKTSSSDKRFKYELDNFPENFEYFILETFDTSTEARKCEAKLQEMFDCANNPLYYNCTNSDFTCGSKYDGIEIYDLVEDKGIKVDNIREFNDKHNVCLYTLLMSNTLLVKDRYCLSTRIAELEYYIMNNLKDKLLTLYTYCETKNTAYIKEATKTIFDWRKEVPELNYTIYSMYNRKTKNCNGYYVERSQCCYNNKLVRLFYINYTKNIIETKYIKMYDMKELSIFTTTLEEMISRRKYSSNGYYYYLEYCEYDYKKYNDKYTFYSKDYPNGLELNVYDAYDLFGNGIHQLIDNKISFLNGVYIDKDLFNYYEVQKFKFYKYIDDSNYEELELTKEEAHKFIGYNYMSVIEGKRISANGYYNDLNELKLRSSKITYWYYDKVKKEISEKTFKYVDGTKVLGPNFRRFYLGQVKSCNNYFKTYEDAQKYLNRKLSNF